MKAAMRHLMRNRRRSILTLLAVMIPVYTLIVMFGFAEANLRDMFDTATRVETGHLQIREASTRSMSTTIDLMQDPGPALEAVARTEGIEWSTVRLDLPALASVGERSQTVFVQGVIPEEIAPISNMRDRVVAGEYLSSDSRGVVVGQELADLLKLGVGDDMILLGAHPDTGLGVLRLPILGIFEAPLAEMGRAVVHVPLAVARELARSTTTASAIVLRIAGVDGPRDEALIDDAQARIAAVLPDGFEVIGWRELVPMAATYMRILAPVLLIVAVIFFGLGGLVVLNTVYLSVMERTRELGMIIALGATRWKVIQMILMEAAVLAGAGAVYGGLIGAGSVWVVEAFGGIPLPAAFSDFMKAVGISGSLHLSTTLGHVLLSAAAMYAVAVLAAWYPAHRASRLEPVEAMRYVE